MHFAGLQWGMTPLMLAVKINENDHLDMVKYLVEDAGADVNMQAVKVLQ